MKKHVLKNLANVILRPKEGGVTMTNPQPEYKPYSPGAVANYFLERSWKENKPITPMKLQKLVYFAQGWTLARLERILIDEPIEAWEYGPVCSSIYHEFKGFGGRAIPEGHVMAELLFPDATVPETPTFQTYRIPDSDKETRSVLESVWAKYSSYGAEELSRMTHIPEKDNPWLMARQAAQKLKIRRGADIPQESIKKFFDKLQTARREY